MDKIQPTPTLSPPPPTPGGISDLLRSLVGWGFRVARRMKGHRSEATVLDAVPASESDKPLVVMIHGFQGNPGEFLYLHAALRHALGSYFDFAVVDTLDPGNDPSPDENCRRIADYLEEHHLAARELYLIGHSMGGVVARCYPHLFHEAVVKAIVLIATPNGGVNSWNLFPIHWLALRGISPAHQCPLSGEPRYPLPAGGRHQRRQFPRGRVNDGVVGLWSVMRFNECNTVNADVSLHTYPHDHWGLLHSNSVATDIAAFLLDCYRTNKS